MNESKLQKIREKRAEAWTALWALDRVIAPELKEVLGAIEKSLEFSGDLCEEVERLHALVKKPSQKVANMSENKITQITVQTHYESGVTHTVSSEYGHMVTKDSGWCSGYAPVSNYLKVGPWAFSVSRTTGESRCELDADVIARMRDGKDHLQTYED